MAVLKRPLLTHEHTQSTSETSNKRRKPADFESTEDLNTDLNGLVDDSPQGDDVMHPSHANKEDCEAVAPSNSTVSQSSVASDMSLGLWAAKAGAASSSFVHDYSLQNWVAEGDGDEQDTASSPEAGYSSDDMESDDELGLMENENRSAHAEHQLSEDFMLSGFQQTADCSGDAVRFPVFGQLREDIGF